jgi:hypothetical protein
MSHLTVEDVAAGPDGVAQSDHRSGPTMSGVCQRLLTELIGSPPVALGGRYAIASKETCAFMARARGGRSTKTWRTSRSC